MKNALRVTQAAEHNRRLRSSRKPRIVLIGTGGTIAGHGESAINTSAYDCSVVPIGDILAAVPAVDQFAHIVSEQIFQLGSENFGSSQLLQLGKRIATLLRRDDIDGVVVTHGTDTLEETAFFLHLTLPSDKPVVVVGAMRPPSSLSADGPLNLLNAIIVACSPLSRGQGTLVVSNDEIHTARDVSKVNTFKLEAFKSPFGPLGYVMEGKAIYYRHVARRHTYASEWSVDDIETLPNVGIVYAHNGLDAAVVQAMVDSDIQALIYAATGNGNIAAEVVPKLILARCQGIRIVRASRTGSGVVVRNAAQPDDQYGWLVAHDHIPQKARILIMIALTGGAGRAPVTTCLDSDSEHDHDSHSNNSDNNDNSDGVCHHSLPRLDERDTSLQQAFFDY